MESHIVTAPYGGMIRIRYTGRSQQLPLSLFHRLPGSQSFLYVQSEYHLRRRIATPYSHFFRLKYQMSPRAISSPTAATAG